MRAGTICLACLVGCVDGTAGKNTPPTATITMPLDGDTLELTGQVLLTGRVSDEETRTRALSTDWSVDGNKVCADVAPEGNGTTSCETVLLEGAHVIGLSVVDEGGWVTSTEVTVEVLANVPPVVSFVTPLPGETFRSDVPVPVEIEASDDDQELSELTVSWSSTQSSDDLSGLPTTLDPLGRAAGTVVFTSGTRVLEVTVDDGRGGIESVSTTVEIDNREPTCAILEPLADTLSLVGDEVTLRGEAADEDSDVLQASWRSSLQGVLDERDVPLDGIVVWSSTSLEVGSHELTLTVVDEQGGTCTDTRTLRVGAAPVFDDVLPDADVLLAEADTLQVSATVSDADHAPGDLVVSLESDLHGTLWSGSPASDGSVAIAVGELSAGTFAWTLTVTDPDGFGATIGGQGIVDGAPSAPDVVISPDEPTIDQDIVASIERPSIDPEGADVTYAWSWSLDGVAGPIGPVLPASELVQGQVWTVTAVPNDGLQDGAATSASVTIVNRVPQISEVRLQPLEPITGDPIEVVAVGEDADGDELSWRYVFHADGLIVQDGEESVWLDGLRGQEVTVEAHASDGFDTVSLWSEPLLVGNAAPSAEAVHIEPERPDLDSTLVCTVTGWQDAEGDQPGYQFAWTVAGFDVPGLTDQEVPASIFGRDLEVGCSAVPDDGIDTGPALYSAGVVVGNRAPVLEAAEVIPELPYNTDIMQVVGVSTSDEDGDPVFLSYQWQVDGVDVSTQSVLLLEPYAPGQTVTVLVTPRDAGGAGEALLFTRVIGDRAPIIEDVTVSPDAPITGDALSVSYQGYDPDGQAITWEVDWYVDGALVTESSDVLPGLERFQVVWVEVRAEADALITTRTTDPIMVSNGVPSVASALVTPASPLLDDILTCTPVGWSDPDGDPPGYQIVWLEDGVALPGQTASTLPAAQLSRRRAYSCRVTPDDGVSLGTSVVSNEVRVLNRQPVVSGGTFDPVSPRVRDVLSVGDLATSDADGDNVSLRYAWRVDGEDAGTGETLDLTPYAKGQTVQVLITPEDGWEDGVPVMHMVEIANTPPADVAVSLAPSVLRTGEQLTATTSAFDADGDTLTWTYTWRVDDVAVQTGEDPTFDAPARDQRVEVEVEVDDGEAVVSAGPSDAAVVVNSLPSLTSAEISPDLLTSGVDLTCTPLGWSDADGDPPDYRFAWSQGGEDLGVSSAVLPADAIAVTGEVFCTVTPFDGLEEGSPVNAPAVAFGNRPPRVVSALLAPAAPNVTSTVQVIQIETADDDGDAVTTEVTWWFGGLEVGQGASLELSGFTKGDEILARIVPDDGTDVGSAYELRTTIDNARPLFQGLEPAANTVLLEDEPLVISATVEDPDGDNVVVELYDETTGQLLDARLYTSDTSFVVETTAPLTWRLVADDMDGGVWEVTRTTEVNAAPTAPGIEITPAVPVQSDTLRVNITASSVDLEGALVSYDYVWTRDGEVTDITGDTVASSRTARGEIWEVTVSARDEAQAGAASVASVSIANTVPSAPVPSLQPEDPTPGEAIQCVFTGGADPDGDEVTYTYHWEVDGQPYTGTTVSIAREGDALPAGIVQLGETWTCTVDASDGLGELVLGGTATLVVVAVDTDGDGVSDDEEALLGTDPTLADSDGDGLEDGEEIAVGSDPLDVDSDDDEYDDALEVANGTDPADDMSPGLVRGSLPYVDVAVASDGMGGTTACALRETGVVDCWGYGVSAAPPAGLVATEIDGGQGICAVADDQTLACWAGAPEAPEGFAFDAVDVGDGVICGRTSTGGAVCFDETGVVYDGSTESYAVVRVLHGYPLLIAADGTWDAPLGAPAVLPDDDLLLDADGDAVLGASFCWVRTDGSVGCSLIPNVPTFDDAVAVAAHGTTACVTHGGSGVTCFGDATLTTPAARGVAANDDVEVWLSPRGGLRWPRSSALSQGPMSNRFERVWAGPRNVCASWAERDVWCAQDSTFEAFEDALGVLPDGAYADIALSRTGWNNCALFDDGTRLCGQGGPAAGPFGAVAVGETAVCVVDAVGEIVCDDGDDSVEVGVETGPLTPGPWRDVFVADDERACGWHTDGTVLCWPGNFFGFDDYSQVRGADPALARGADGTWVSVPVAESPAVLPSGNYAALDAYAGSWCGVASLTGEVTCSGVEPGTMVDLVGIPFVDVAMVDETSACGVSAAGELYCWGEHAYRRPVAVAGADVDSDGLDDALVEATLGTRGTSADTDGDGLSDGYEHRVTGTSPSDPDSDGDGTSDGAEVEAGTDPLAP